MATLNQALTKFSQIAQMLDTVQQIHTSFVQEIIQEVLIAAKMQVVQKIQLYYQVQRAEVKQSTVLTLLLFTRSNFLQSRERLKI